MKSNIDKQEEEQAKARYNRIAWMYDAAEYIIEHFVFEGWRQRLWSKIPSNGHGLEVGVGTGKNMPFYPRDGLVTAIDLSDKMITRARERAKKLVVDVELVEMNVERLSFPDNYFDWAVATFVFCSVPNPVQGLNELARVVKPGGQVFLLEHVRIDKPVLGIWMDLWNPIVVRLTGANINRQTVNNVMKSSLNIEKIENVGPFGATKLISASA